MDEVKGKKANCETEILRIVSSFMRETGCSVLGIRLEVLPVHEMNGKKVLVNSVELDVRL